MRQMVEDVMAKVIEFYVPDSLQKKANVRARNECGKLIEFRSAKAKQNDSHSVEWHSIGPVHVGFAVNFVGDRPGDSV